MLIDNFAYYMKSVHKPARVSRFVTLGLTTPKSDHKPAKVNRFFTPIRKSILYLKLSDNWCVRTLMLFLKCLICRLRAKRRETYSTFLALKT